MFEQLEKSFNLPSPITELYDPIFKEKNIKVFVKRDDLIHPNVSGNKWRKLKYNVEAFLRSEKKEILTFGGPYSNHIHATAALGRLLNIPTLGIVNYHEFDKNNPTLSFANECGMRLQFYSRSEYRRLKNNEYPIELEQQYPSAYIIPEGGNNNCGELGMKDLAKEILEYSSEFKFDKILLASGTSCTANGLATYVSDQIDVIAANVLKYKLTSDKMEIWNDCHLGGYAKINAELISFINEFKSKHNIALDPIYTGKLFYTFYQKLKTDYFNPGSNILLIHTGGLQGIIPMNQKNENKPELLLS